MNATQSSVSRNLLLVANYESDVGYAWWLMETFWIWLANIAAQQGRKTYLIYPRITSLPDSISSSIIQVRQLVFPTGKGDDISEIKEFVEQNQIGVLYLTDRPYASSIYRALRELGVQTIINHDHSPGTLTLSSFIKWLPKRLSIVIGRNYCDHYIAVSEYVHRKHILGAGIPSSMCHVVRNGIPLVDMPTAHERETRRLALGFAPSDFVIVSVGRADAYKGIDFLISCAKSMQDDPRFCNVRFMHCGAGPHLEAFRNQICDLSIGHRFRCLGHRSDIPEILSACDIAVHASPAEAGSLAILEYMAAGLPVIAPNVGANSEQIANKVTGLFYEYRHEASLKEKISCLISNETLRHTMGRRGRERVEQLFSLEVCRVQFESVVSKLLS